MTKKKLMKNLALTFILCGTAFAMMNAAFATKRVLNRTNKTTVVQEGSISSSDTKTEKNKGLDTHEYVDLELPSGTLWATCNVGAENPGEYGNYFAWGETKPKANYDWITYKHINNSGLCKYCAECKIELAKSMMAKIDNKLELEAEDDAATVNWGNDWQMPSEEQFAELIDTSYTTTSWTTQNGVNGRLIISKSNGNRIFLPAAGYRDETILCTEGDSGDYWTSSLVTQVPGYGRYLMFTSGYIYTNALGFNGFYRRCGLSVRPVRRK